MREHGDKKIDATGYRYEPLQPSDDDALMDKFDQRFGGFSRTIPVPPERVANAPSVPDIPPPMEFDKNGRPVNRMGIPCSRPEAPMIEIFPGAMITAPRSKGPFVCANCGESGQKKTYAQRYCPKRACQKVGRQTYYEKNKAALKRDK